MIISSPVRKSENSRVRYKMKLKKSLYRLIFLGLYFLKLLDWKWIKKFGLSSYEWVRILLVKRANFLGTNQMHFLRFRYTAYKKYRAHIYISVFRLRVFNPRFSLQFVLQILLKMPKRPYNISNNKYDGYKTIDSGIWHLLWNKILKKFSGTHLHFIS